MYTDVNFKTKKAFKEAVKAGRRVGVYQPGIFPGPSTTNGEVCIEGPHYPRPHTWYATATLADGHVIKVK